jgi:hypothetical protein
MANIMLSAISEVAMATAYQDHPAKPFILYSCCVYTREEEEAETFTYMALRGTTKFSYFPKKDEQNE